MLIFKWSMSYFEQIQEATPHKRTTVWPLTSHPKKHPSKTNKTCRTSKDELISDILLWTLTHGHASDDQPARIYLHQLYADTGYSLENLPGAMDDWDGWRERESQGNPYWQHNLLLLMMMMMMIMMMMTAYLNLEFFLHLDWLPKQG